MPKSLTIVLLIFVIAGALLWLMPERGLWPVAESIDHQPKHVISQSQTSTLSPSVSAAPSALSSANANIPSSSAHTESPSKNLAEQRVATDLCLLNKHISSEQLGEFQRRFSYLGLTQQELLELVAMFKKTGLSAQLQQNESSVDGQQQALLEQMLPEQNDTSVTKNVVNQKLSDSYQYREGQYYEFDQTQFERALNDFVAVYRDTAAEALPLLYLHMKSAGRHYWRNARQPDWRKFVHFEHHRQALIYLIYHYGTEQDRQMVFADRWLLSTVNRFTGELDRGYGGVLMDRVHDKIVYYRRNLDLTNANREAALDPEHLPAEADVSFLPPDDSESGRYFDQLRRRHRSDVIGELMLALGKECRI